MDAIDPRVLPRQQLLDARKAIPWIIFLVFFGVLNETVFTVSTPAIARQYGLNPSGVSWVMTTFIILFGIGSVVYGRLSDIYSLKRLIVIGVVIYAAGSLAGFVLQRFYPAVIAARAVQGAGASAIPALIMVLVARFFPPSDRGKVFGTITSTAAFAAGVGPVIGGFVSGSLHWAYLFLIPLLTLVSIPFFLRVLPGEPRRDGGLDILGAGLVSTGVAALILFLSFPAWYFPAASALLLAAFIAHARRVRDPFIDLSLFANRPFRGGLLVGFIVFCVAFGVFFVTPLMLSGLRGSSTREIGLVMFPGAISGVFFGTFGGRLADRRGNRFVMTIALSLLAASLLLLSLLLASPLWALAAALLLTYIGFSLLQTALVNSVSQTLEMRQTGVGMGLFNLVSFISGAVGAAFVGRVLGSGGLGFPLNPLVANRAAFPYGNLLLLFAALVVLGGVVYFRSYRRSKG